MINLTKFGKIAFLAFAMGLLPSFAMAEIVTKGGVTIEYTPLDNGSISIKYASNKSPHKIFIEIDGKNGPTILANGSATVNQVARKWVKFNRSGSSGLMLWKYEVPVTPKVVEEEPEKEIKEVKEVKEVKTTPSPVEKPRKEIETPKPRHDEPRMVEPTTDGSPMAIEMVNEDSFFGIKAVAGYVQKVDSLTKALSQSEDKKRFLIDNDIENFLNESEIELQIRTNEIPSMAQEAIVASKIYDLGRQTRTLNLLIEILNGRINQRKTAFTKLQEAVKNIPTEPKEEKRGKDPIVNYLIVGVIVLVLIGWLIIVIRKKKNKATTKQPVTPVSQPVAESDNPSIVVRRRTTSILKKQSIEDVINNPEYMLINTSEFTPDSAVRNIYIKNTCIKDVYNLYAEDLRNSDNPKEDGCMVLGRWVYNEDTHTYDISMETVVFPGDDAVFKEYELNFGGKIKLRIAEKLRKLRRETGLQYDLVCWIHSHPGLGVFFSNSDDNVQMQLKHSQHPYFLIAFVVDILTSNQELGIFTFRKDGSMNSKGDLTKMFSLEDMYKWALESDKVSFNQDNYHNILASAKMRIPNCNGIQLNNSSIIDLTQIVIEPATGIVGWALGTTIETNGGKEYVVSSIVKADGKPTTGVIGALLNVPHMSLPTIQRLIANANASPSFVMVYSSRQNTLTSIPVINGELITDEHFYGEETIDDLKIWTRRRR